MKTHLLANIQHSYKKIFFVLVLLLVGFSNQLFSQAVDIDSVNNTQTFNMPANRPCGTQIFDAGDTINYIGDNSDYWICFCASGTDTTSTTLNYDLNNPGGSGNDDFIYVYEGCGTGGTLLFGPTTGTGTTTVTASAPGLCLTVRIQETGNYNPAGVFGLVGTMDCIPGLVGIDPNDPSALLSVYPNPATSEIHLKTNEVISGIRCFNMVGELIDLKIENNSIDISHLTNGLYHLIIITPEGHQEISSFTKQ